MSGKHRKGRLFCRAKEMHGKMRAVACSAAAAGWLLAPAYAQQDQQINPLVTGRSITPPAPGLHQNVGSLPMHMILSPDGKYAIVSDMGFRESLSVLNTADGTLLSSVPYSNEKPNASSNGLYYGLAITPQGVVYAAQGGNDSIAVLQLSSNGMLTQTGTIMTKKGDFPTGLSLDSRGFLYVANNDPSTFKTPCSVAVYDTKTNSEVGRVAFTSSFGGTPNFPLGIAAVANGSKIYVSSQRDGSVYILNAANPAAPAIIGQRLTGGHPTGLLLNKAQTRLWVANGSSDTVSLMDTRSDRIIRTFFVNPQPFEFLVGSTPTGLALSPDEKTLYASLGDANAVVSIDAVHSRINGLIPVGWYPSAVVVSPDNGRLLVANAKGTTTRNPNSGYINDTTTYYIENIIEGDVSTINIPTGRALQLDTRQVLQNNRFIGQGALSSEFAKAKPQIKHIIYIVKENRTYDQVLGDLPQGNGDPSLTMYGSNVTPNQHALASRFLLLDNFYDCSEVSGDGWPWSTQAYANEFVIKNLPYNYSGRGRNYDFEGQNNGYLTGGFPAADPDGKPLSPAFPTGLPPIPDVAESPGGHIWDLVQNSGRSYRNYGFFYSFGVSVSGATVLPDNYPASRGIQPAGHDLAGKSDIDFRRFDGNYPDSDAPSIYATQQNNQAVLFPTTTYGKYNMPSRFSEWNREFNEMLAKAPAGNGVPTFMTVRFMNDHTQGTTPGKHTPRSEVADNDYAVGQLVQAVSKSPIWNSTAIFVIEDDAQDGADHIDAHRSTCYIISPFIKAQTVNHTFYNTTNVLRTMEALLGLPAMTQYDYLADSIAGWDQSPNNAAPFTAILPDAAIIAEKNPQLSAMNPRSVRFKLAKLSQSLDFAHPDSAPAAAVNEILWRSAKGLNVPVPTPQHHVIPVQKGSGAVQILPRRKVQFHPTSGTAAAHVPTFQRTADD